MILFLGAPALATPPGDMLFGFAVETRDDAPVDARLLLDANYVPEAIVSDGPEAPVGLAGEMLVAYSMGNDPLVAMLPPAGAWQPGAAYTVTALGSDYASTGDVALSFTAGDAPAADPLDPEVLDVEVSDWSEDADYLWGCCEPTRTVTVTVWNPSSDPWSYVELLGDFQGPSQLTTEPILSHLGAGIGPGEHSISFTQWKRDETLNPLTFSVAAVEADGDRSAEVAVDVPDGSGSLAGCGCEGAPGGHGGLVLALAITIGARSCRSSRSRSAAGTPSPRSASAA